LDGRIVFVGFLSHATFALLSAGETEEEARKGLLAQWNKVARKKNLMMSSEEFEKEFGKSPLEYHGATFSMVPFGGGIDLWPGGTPTAEKDKELK